MMLAIILVLTALEHMLPPLPLLPPNVKLGLSNIVTMYCVFFVGRASAVTMNALKAFFVFLTRGPMAGILSLSGGMLSIGIIILLTVIFKDKISYAIVSVAGAVAHNLGQYAAVSLIMQTVYMVYYLPVLLVAGVVMGVVTGVLLKVILPVFKRISKE
jgi:heptaprenyl diphosphate synthase